MRLKSLMVAAVLVTIGCWAKLAANDLEGRWTASFALDSAWRLIAQPQSHALSGVITLGAAPETPMAADTARHVHSGSSAIDFAPFGFTLAKPEVIAWPRAADSVRMILNPSVDHGLVELDGTRKGERIEGQWQMISDPGGARGTFVLERRRSP